LVISNIVSGIVPIYNKNKKVSKKSTTILQILQQFYMLTINKIP